MLSVGVISEDSNSQDIFEFVKKTKNVQLTGQYFSNPLENFRRASDSNITNFTDFDEFASSCDALIIPYIGTETYQLIIHALRKSRHALIGNPLIMEPDQMEHLMKLSEEGNLVKE